jgi:hypothetical protein
MEILCTHVWKWKNEINWNYSRTEEGREGKEEWLREWILQWYVIRILVNVTTYPQYYNNKKKRKKEKNQQPNEEMLQIIWATTENWSVNQSINK